MTLTIEDVESLLRKMKRFGRPAEVDWVNRTIYVVSEVKTHPTKIMSDGKPMTYRDYLCRVETNGL